MLLLYAVIRFILLTSNIVMAVESSDYLYVPCCSKSQTGNSSCLSSLEELEDDEWTFIFSNETSRDNLRLKNYNIEQHCEDVDEVTLDNQLYAYRFDVSNEGVSLIRWLKNGSHEAQETFNTFEFCMSDFNNRSVKICHERISNEVVRKEGSTLYFDCTSNLCVSKCCPETHFVNLSPKAFGCVKFENDSVVKLLHPQFQLTNGTKVSVPKNIAYTVQFPLCKLYKEDEIILLPNGSSFLPSTGEVFGINGYCLDFFRIGDETTIRGSLCSKTYVLSRSEQIRQMLHPLGFFVSCVLLAVTFICHVIIPKLRDMQGRCFMSYVAALFFAFLLLSANNLLPNRISSRGCVALAVMNHFTLLAAFFWLNVMCFDIWRTIRGTVNAVRIEDLKSNEVTRFIFYSAYAWGGPFIVSLAALIIHVIPKEAFPPHFIRPEFRMAKCWFSDDIKVLFAYYNGIIAVLFFVNAIFLIHISLMLKKAGVAFKCCTKDVSHDGELRMGNRSNLSTFWHRFCLFAIMALAWSTEVLSLIPPPAMWVLTDFLNTLQGLFIFLLFIRSAKKRTYLFDAWKKVVRKTRPKKRGHQCLDISSDRNMIAKFIKPDTTQDSDNQIQFIDSILEPQRPAQ